MIVETVLILGGAVVTAAVGVPLAVRLARPAAFGRHAPLDRAANRTQVDVKPAFIPLDLGPDLMRWPSEVDRSSTGVVERPWPSQTWDDPHFGAFWRRAEISSSEVNEQAYLDRQAKRKSESHDRREAAAQAPQRPTRALAEERGRMSAASDRAREQADQAARQARDAARREAEEARVAARRGEEQARAAARRAEEQARRATPPRPEPRASQAPSAAGSAPSAREVEQMVASLGLAGTVQEIMQRTGWDFRQAAHYLARVRQQGN